MKIDHERGARSHPVLQGVRRAASWLALVLVTTIAVHGYEQPAVQAARVFARPVFQAKRIPVYLNYAEQGMCYGNLRYTGFDLEKLEFVLKEVIENHNAASVSHSQLTYGGTVCLTDPFPFVDDEPAALEGKMWFGLMEQWAAAYSFEEAFPGIIVTAVSECPADFVARMRAAGEMDNAKLESWADIGGRAGRLSPEDLDDGDQAEADANGWPLVPWGLVYLARLYDDDGMTVCPPVDPTDPLARETACSIDNPGLTVGDPCPMGVLAGQPAATCDCWNPATNSADEDAGVHDCEPPPDDDADMGADGDPRIGPCRCGMTGAKLHLDAPRTPDPDLVDALEPQGGDPGGSLRCDVRFRNKSLASNLAHEIGHVIGLAHPDMDSGAGDPPDGSDELDSIMSYNRIYDNRAYGHSVFRRDDLQAIRYVYHDPPPNPPGEYSEPILGDNDWQEDFVVRWRSASVAIGSSPPAETSWNSPNTETSIASIVAPTMSTAATRASGENYPRVLAIGWVDAERAVHVVTMGPSGIHSLPDTEIPGSNTPYRPAVALADPGILAAWVTDPSIYGFERDIEWAIRPAETSEWDEWEGGSLATGLAAYCAGLSPCPDDGYCVPNGQACEYQGGLANLSGRISVGYDQAHGEYLLVYAPTGYQPTGDDLAVVRISDSGDVQGWNVWNGGQTWDGGNEPRYITHFSRPLCTTFTQSTISSSVCSILFIDNPRGVVRAVQWARDGTDGVLPNLNLVEFAFRGVSGLELVGEGYAGSTEYTLFLRGDELGIEGYGLVLETTSSTFPLQLPDGFIANPQMGLADLDWEEEPVIPNWPLALGNRFSDDLNNTVYTVWGAAPPPDNYPGTPYGDTDTDGTWGNGSEENCNCRSGGERAPMALLVGLLLACGVRRRPRSPESEKRRAIVGTRAGAPAKACVGERVSAVVVAAAVVLVACRPSTESDREGLCGTVLRPPRDTCGNAREDPGELCFRRDALELRGSVGSIRVLDVDGDGIADMLSTGDEPMFSGVSLRRGLGDGTFADREHTDLPTWRFVELATDTGFDFLGVGTYDPDEQEDEDEEVRLVAYKLNGSGEFEPTVLDSLFAPYTVPIAVGVGEVDGDGSYRVYVRLSDVESGEDGDVVYEVNGNVATRSPPVAGASGQPHFLPAATHGIWIADLDGDGLEDSLQPHAFVNSHDETTELDSSRFLEELHWLVDRGDIACEALDTMNFSDWSYSFDTERLDTEQPTNADDSSRGRALARLSADTAFDLVFTNDAGSFVAIGSIGPACVPRRTYSDTLEWPPCPELEFAAIEKLADVPWGSVTVADLDGDGLQDIVGTRGEAIDILLGAR